MQLRHPRVWLALGWLMVAGVVIASLVPARTVEFLVGDLNDKLEHSVAYAALMVWFGGMFRKSLQVWIGMVLVVLGGVIELLQGLTPTRTPDVLDLAADSIGVLIALALSLTLLHGWCQRIERLFAVR
ncbi:MAG TPA: VanZ family protein [Gammaproteobacteria bacterium]|nr:VanZ family protein [Gammaproteobacteria bacterium]